MRALCSLLLFLATLSLAPTLASAACLGASGPNGIVEAGEACDDGDNDQHNGCTNQCTIAQGYQCEVAPVGLTPEQQSALVCAVNMSAAWTATPLGGEQTANSVPTIAATGIDAMAQAFTIDITPTGTDNDYIGFALGFSAGDMANPSADYLLVDWDGGGALTNAGKLRVKRVQGVPNGVSCDALLGWEIATANGPHVTTLATVSSGPGATAWVPNRALRFFVSYTPTSLQIRHQGALIVELSSPATSPFPGGEVGFYGLSQTANYALYLPSLCSSSLDLSAVGINLTNVQRDAQALTIQGSVEAFIKLDSASAVGPYTVRAFLDADGDGAYGPNDAVIGDVVVNTHPSNAALPVTIPIMGVQLTDFAGQDIGFIIDPSATLAESNPSNNTLLRSQQACSPAQANLTVSWLRYDLRSWPASGQLTARIGNGGAGAAPAGALVRLYDGANTTMPVAATTLLAPLARGAFTDVSVVWPGPLRDLDALQGPLSVMVDPDNALAECDDADNTHQLIFPIVGQISAPAQGGPALTSPHDTAQGQAQGASALLLTLTRADGSVVATETISPLADGSWAWPMGPLANGDYTLTTVARTDDGSYGPPRERDLSVAVTIPISFSAPAPMAVLNQSTPTLSGDTVPGAEVTILIADAQGQPVSTLTATADAAGAWSATPPMALMDGAYVATASVSDALGNSASTQTTFTIATSAGELSISAPTDAQVVRTVTTALAGSVSDDVTTVSLSLIDADGMVVESWNAPVDAHGQWSVSSPMLEDGQYTLRASARRPNGQTLRAEARFTVDLSVMVTLTTPADGALLSADAPFDITGTASPGAQVSVSVDGAPFATTTADAAGAWAVSAAVPSDVDTFELLVTARNDAGRTASDGPHAVTIERPSPSRDPLVIAAPTDGATLDGPDVVVSGSAEPNTTLTIWLDGELVDEVVSDDEGRWQLTLTEVAPGEHAVSARDGVLRDDATFSVRPPDAPVDPVDPLDPFDETVSLNGSTSCAMAPQPLSPPTRALAWLMGLGVVVAWRRRRPR